MSFKFRLSAWTLGPALLRCSVLLGALLATVSVWSAQTLTISIVPQFSARQIFSDWTPVLKIVGEKAGVDFKLNFYDSIPQFESGFMRGESDLAYMNPYHMVMAKNAAGYQPIIRDDANRLSGILVVRKDSSIENLSQLDGKKIAFPAPNAFGASLYMRALLAREAKINITPLYVKTHPNVYRHVLLGQAEAGGGVNRTLNDEREDVRSQLRILYRTPEVYSHPIAVHPRVQPELAQRLQAAFLEAGRDPANADLFKNILIPKPAKSTYEEYAALGALKLESFVGKSN